MCGVSGVYLASKKFGAAYILHESLVILQHRGQDAAGIATCNGDGKITIEKNSGLVREVFDESNINKLEGNMGIAHVRYPTSGSKNVNEAQPFYTNCPYGISMAHNGNLTNSNELRELVVKKYKRHVSTSSDSELLMNLFAESLYRCTNDTPTLTNEHVIKALKSVYAYCRGGFSCTGLIANFGIFGFRDSNGIRPLVCGKRETLTGGKPDYMLASETAALNVFKFNDYFDLKPGEVVIVTKEGFCREQVAPSIKFTPDIFEYIYFARADSVIDGVPVHKARVTMGDALAHNISKKLDVSKIDSVIAVPDTGRISALQLSSILNIPYREGFVKNRYIGRTFIMASTDERILNIRRKITPIVDEFKGKNVLLVDDSIVRGTTSKEIIKMARTAGACRVYLASCSPPIRYPNFYGIDTPTRSELIASNKTEVEIAAEIGADCVIFQDIDQLTKSVTTHNKNLSCFDLSVFNGNYVTGDIDENYILELEKFKKNSTSIPLNGQTNNQKHIFNEYSAMPL